MAKTTTKRRTKASRTAAAKKAAATRKRNANKRSASAKKAAATRKRNSRKGSRKSATRRPTTAKRSAAAKKAAATRRRNANKRSASAKKAAATRKRNARKGSRKSSSKSRSRKGTKASRSAAAKKAWRTRRRNAGKRAAPKRRASKKRAAPKRRASRKPRTSKAKRAAAARKGWRTRRSGTAGKRRGKRRARATSVASVKATGKNLTSSMMNSVNLLPGALFSAATAFLAIGAYNAVKPLAWDTLKITGPSGYLARAVSYIPGTPNTSADLQNFAEKSLALATIGGMAYLVSSKKALNLINPKTANQAVGLAAILYGANFLSEMQSMNVGSAVGALSKGNFGAAKNSLLSGTGRGGLGKLGMSHTEMPLFGAHQQQNYSLVRGTGNMPAQIQTSNTAAIQQGSGSSGFFGTRSAGASRVNLF